MFHKFGCNNVDVVSSRREFLLRGGAGFGAIALAGLMSGGNSNGGYSSYGFSSAAAADENIKARFINPLAAKKPLQASTAKNVIFCFIDGGPSHIDLFDPKPELLKQQGKPLPSSIKRPMTAMGATSGTPLLASKRTFKQHGQSGIWVSDWLPHIAKQVDNLCILRGCTADGQTHVGSVCQMNTGSILPGRASLGSWALYGLGSEAENLPGFVLMTDYDRDPPGGSLNWSSGFLPALYQGTRMSNGKSPFPEVIPATDVSNTRQRSKLDFIQELNRRHASERPEDDKLSARISAYELAYQMQAAAPDAVDLSKETEATKKMYGIDVEETSLNGRNCLLARRLVERGVRFVQLYMGAGSKWDAHSDVEGNHSMYCKEMDQPVAALIADLKQRGMLDSTLVIWGGEFGRTPMSESGDGRDHNPFGFTMFMAGGGVKPGLVHGATDEFGLYAIEGNTHVHDIHATILHMLGFDHEALTFAHNGRDERLTITSGEVIKEILRG